MIHEVSVVAIKPAAMTLRPVELDSRPVININGNITPLEEVNKDSAFVKTLNRLIENCIC